MSSPHPIPSSNSPHLKLSRPCSFSSNSRERLISMSSMATGSLSRERLIPMSPMATGSPSHISEPIHIQIPRRRLFSPTSEESQDSGFDSPTYHLIRRVTLQEHSNVIYENLEDAPNGSGHFMMNEPVFQFDEEDQNHQAPPSTLLIVASSPVRRSNLAASPTRRSTIATTSPSRHSANSITSSRHSNFPTSPATRSSIFKEEQRHPYNPTLSSSVPVSDHHQQQHNHHHLITSPYRTSAAATGTGCNSWFYMGYEGGRARSRSGTPFYLYDCL